MKYLITEVVETVSYSSAIADAPAELVKTFKEMSERGEVATFAKVILSDSEFIWVILTANSDVKLTIAKRHTEITKK